MIAKENWQDLIPHRGDMSLLHAVVAWDDATIHATAISHRAANNPLRSDGVLRAVHLCEYGAQAMAVHGGLLAQRAGSSAAPGFLVSLRGVELAVTRLDDLDSELHVRAEMVSVDDASLLYAFHIDHAGRRIGEGRAMVSIIRRSASGTRV